MARREFLLYERAVGMHGALPESGQRAAQELLGQHYRADSQGKVMRSVCYRLPDEAFYEYLEETSLLPAMFAYGEL